jgi:aminoglycoside phosphotransferase (APT) family kinase protein
MDSDLAHRLAAVLGADDVGDLRQLSGGASRETWSAEVDQGGRRRRVILQRQRAGGDRSMAREADVLRVARRGGVPVPEVLASSDDPALLGAAFTVLEHVEGETIARRILRDDEFAGARPVLAAQMAEAAARLHALEPVPGLEAPDQLQTYRELLDLLGQPHPAFELAFRWLDGHRPPPTRTTMVHGDLRLGNVIVGADGLRAVLDWELAHLGDPVEDLGWMCVKAWRFGSPHPAAGVGSYDQLLDAYAAASGLTVEAEVLRWWEVLGTLKWGIMCIMQANVHLSGTARSHELAAIGRRVCENEHDLFLLLP